MQFPWWRLDQDFILPYLEAGIAARAVGKDENIEKAAQAAAR